MAAECSNNDMESLSLFHNQNLKKLLYVMKHIFTSTYALDSVLIASYCILHFLILLQLSPPFAIHET
jgi:hypothetical protein